MHLRFFPALTLCAVLVGVAVVAACPPGRHIRYYPGPVVFAMAEEKPAPKKAAANGDWPMYGGTPSRNMVNTVAKGIPTEWEPKKGGKNVKWIADIGDRGYMPPAIAGGKVYIATNNHKPRDPKVKGDKAILMCFNEADGKFLWQIAHDMPSEEITANQTGAEGLLSTPVIEGDRLYYVTPAAEVVCASTEGKVLWTCDLIKQFEVYPHFVTYGSPVVVGDLVYAVTGNGRDGNDATKPVPKPKAPSFVAIDKKDGKVVWHDNSPGDKIMEGTWSSPLYAEVNGKGQVIFPGGDGWLYAFAAAREKKLIWKFDGNPKGSKYDAGSKGTRSYILTPAVHENRLYTAVGQQPDHNDGIGHLWCVDITKTGDISEELAPGKPNPNSGLKWQFGKALPKSAEGRDWTFGRSISGFAIHDGLVYAAELSGFFHCLDAKTGEEYWQDDFKASVWASPLWVDGKVYIPDDQGIVHIFQHGKEKKALGSIDMEDAVKATPVVANGVLYITLSKHLYAIGGK